MREPTFDIFSGTPDRDAVWLECVDGLSEARQRLDYIGTVRPGAYFLYDHASRSVIAKSGTTKQLEIEFVEK
jgi:hypothetical protein